MFRQSSVIIYQLLFISVQRLYRIQKQHPKRKTKRLIISERRSWSIPKTVNTKLNEFSDTKADRVVILSYEYENISLNNDLYISDFNFKLYDKENNALDSYPADVKYPDSVGISVLSATILNMRVGYGNMYSSVFSSLCKKPFCHIPTIKTPNING